MALIFWIPGAALAYEVAVVDARGPAEEALLGELMQAVVDALEQEGHEVSSEQSVHDALSKLALTTVETQKEADHLGASLGVSFVICPYVSPLAGQNRIEILAYFLPDGRAEMLEQIAIEGELRTVVQEMIARLVTKEGLLGTGPAPSSGMETEHEMQPEPGAQDEPEPSEGEPTDEELLEQLDDASDDVSGESQKPTRPGLGDPYRLHAVLTGGYALLLNEPATGGSSYRHGGRIAITIGYVLVPKIGLEVAGDIHTYVGPSGVGFGLTASTGVHFAVHERFLVGARLGVGFYKGATGAQRASFLLTASPTFEVILHERVFLRFTLPHFTVLAGGDRQVPGVGIMGFYMGIGARF